MTEDSIAALQRELEEVREAQRADKAAILKALGITEPWALTTWSRHDICTRIEQQREDLRNAESYIAVMGKKS